MYIYIYIYRAACTQVFSSGGTCILYLHFWGCNVPSNSKAHKTPVFANSVQEGQSSVYDTKNTECTTLRGENAVHFLCTPKWRVRGYIAPPKMKVKDTCTPRWKNLCACNERLRWAFLIIWRPASAFSRPLTFHIFIFFLRTTGHNDTNRHIISVMSKSFDEGSPENNIIKILHEILKLSFDKCSHENNQIKM
jgi:hypothetical protein